jgi:RNA polymerase sigma-70 factor (ECF subfamily)
LQGGTIGEADARLTDTLERLLTRVASGDRSAFRELYRATAPTLYAVVRALIRNQERSDEILQDAYVKIWRNAKRFDPQKDGARARRRRPTP